MDSQLPNYSKTPEKDKIIRFAYRKAAAEQLSKHAVFDSEKFVNLYDTPATRLAAEFVAQYINKHMMGFTADALEIETNNHVRQKHSEKWISHRLKLADGATLIEQLRAPPVTHDSMSTATSTPTKPPLSPPPQNSMSVTGTESTRKIHVRVKKDRSGKLKEDPRKIVQSKKGFDRISRKDRETLMRETRTNEHTAEKIISNQPSKNKLPAPPPELINRELAVETDLVNESKNTAKSESLFSYSPKKREHSPRELFEKAPNIKPRMMDAEIEPDTMHQLEPTDRRTIREAQPTLSFVSRINQQLEREAFERSQQIEELKRLIEQKEHQEIFQQDIGDSNQASIGSDHFEYSDEGSKLSPSLSSRLSRITDNTPPTSPVSAASMTFRKKVDLRKPKVQKKESDYSDYSY